MSLTLHGSINKRGLREQSVRIGTWVHDLTDSWRRPGDQLQLVTVRDGRVRPHRAGWDELIAHLAAVSTAGMSMHLADAQGRTRASFRWEPSHDEVSELVLTMACGPAAGISVGGFVRRSIQAAEISALAQGSVTTSALPRRLFETSTPFERKYGTLRPNQLNRYVRGVGWALWLTEGHLALLGGRELVRRTAPVYRVIDRPTGAWLQLTPSPWEIHAPALDAFQHFLSPVWPRAEDGGFSYRPRNQKNPLVFWISAVHDAGDGQRGQAVVIGRCLSGRLPDPGTTIYVNASGRVLAGEVVSLQSESGRSDVSLTLIGLPVGALRPGRRLVADAYDPALRPVVAPRFAVDESYRDYAGPALHYTWAEIGGVDFDINIQLAYVPSEAQRASLEHLVQTWCRDGEQAGYPEPTSASSSELEAEAGEADDDNDEDEQFERGYLHGVTDPLWEGSVVSWGLDSGSASSSALAEDLSRRLAGWAVRWSCAITDLWFGHR